MEIIKDIEKLLPFNLKIKKDLYVRADIYNIIKNKTVLFRIRRHGNYPNGDKAYLLTLNPFKFTTYRQDRYLIKIKNYKDIIFKFDTIDRIIPFINQYYNLCKIKHPTWIF